jgi:hypothetical protein
LESDSALKSVGLYLIRIFGENIKTGSIVPPTGFSTTYVGTYTPSPSKGLLSLSLQYFFGGDYTG